LSGPLKPGEERSETARIGDRLRNLDAQLLALEVAIENFGRDGLQGPAWLKAYSSGDPDDLLRVNAIMGTFEHIVQNVVAIAKAGGRITGQLEQRRPRSQESIEMLERVGALSSAGRERLNDLFLFRSRVSHGSPDVKADEMARYAERVIAEVPPKITGVRAWLEHEGINLSA